jgi:hypothetical protein
MAKGNRPATSSAEDSLPLGAPPKDMEFSEPAESAAPVASLGPRVKVHAHGALVWDSSHYAADEEFQVDTSKHSEADFLALLASETLLRAE